jgi:hypothetical protein
MSPVDPEDECLAAALRAIPVPATPAGLDGLVREAIRRRRARATAAAIWSLMAVAIVLILWQPRVTPKYTPTPGPVVVREIPAEDLEVLFAPPPVDRLTVLAARNDVSLAALGRLEGVK